MKLNFCIPLEIHRSKKFTQSFQVIVVRHVWACAKLCQIMSQLQIENELSYEVGFFCMSLGVHRSYRFFQSFQVGLVRPAHSDD